MIACLRGHVALVEPDAVVVDVGGVGYRVHVPTSLLAELGAEGTVVMLHTRLLVRENEMVLYGAADAETLRLFDALLSVTGVGPRLAMALLSTHDLLTLRRAIVAEDASLLTATPGVGRKTAGRIILELKARLAGEDLGGPLAGGPSLPADDEALSALEALGYSRAEARRALGAAAVPSVATVEERLLAALRALSR